MKKLTQRFIACFLVLALTVSAAACYSEDNLWAAKKDALTLPIGGYIYYLTSAYSSAASKVNSETNVLKATFEEKSAENWIRDTAIDSVRNYFYVHEKFNELGLELTEDDQATIDSYMTTYYWGYGQSAAYEALGISESSMRTAGPELYVMRSMIFEAMYGPDGENAVSDDALRTYYNDNYFAYEYFSASLSAAGEDGSSVDFTDNEKKTLKSTLETMKTKIEGGSLTVTDAAAEYQTDAALEESTYHTYTDSLNSTSSGEISNAAQELKDEGVTIIETTSAYVLIRRIPIQEKTEEMLTSEDTRLSALHAFKNDDFTAFLEENSAAVEGIVFNDKAMNLFKLSKLVDDKNKKGTSSAVSEVSEDLTESAANSAAASETSETGSEVSGTGEALASSETASESSAE